MKIIQNPPAEMWKDLISRPVFDGKELKDQVTKILDGIKNNGIQSVIDYTRQFDGYTPDPLKVSPEEIREAADKLSPELKSAIGRAAKNVEIFHRNQMIEPPVVYISNAIQCWQKDVPIEKVGFYIPGGTAPLFSTVLMLGIPAMIAGCEETVLCSPAGKDGKLHPAVLYAASICRIKHVFCVGGVQAIGAMAYGAGEIPAVDKIFGPGNQYVTMAKQLVSDEGIAIDLPAGPSEVLVIADHTADPAFVAADLLSQAEHGADSQVVLLCSDVAFANAVNVELELQVQELPRKEIALQALQNSFTLIMKSVREMVDFSNLYAPEHLILSVENSRRWASDITNAGSVFIGSYTPESAGDYASGTNHTLPTNGYARAYSGLNLKSFMKTIQFQEINRDGLLDLGPAIMEMAKAEGLCAHSRAVEIRLKKPVL